MYVLKFNNKTTRKKWNMFKVNSKDTERRQWRLSDVLIVNFEHISHLL